METLSYLVFLYSELNVNRVCIYPDVASEFTLPCFPPSALIECLLYAFSTAVMWKLGSLLHVFCPFQFMIRTLGREAMTPPFTSLEGLHGT